MSNKAAIERVASLILVVRGQRVMLDSDLAELYGVETRALIQAVKRNLGRFPPDFMFQLSPEELELWRSQIVISKPGARMGLRRPPYVFTEHGALQLASVLKSQRAEDMSILVVRAFVRLREILSTNRALAEKLRELEQRIETHDEAIAEILAAIRELMKPPEPSRKRPIGFVSDTDKG